MRAKKGDISVVILVIGIFAVCALAIITFIVSTSKTQGSFVQPSAIENATVQLNTFYFYLNSGMSPTEAAERIGAKFDAGNNRLTIDTQQNGMAVQYNLNVGDS